MTKETSKCYEFRQSKGYFENYLVGNGIDIGGGDDSLIVPNGQVLRYDKEQGDAQTLSNLEDNTFDFIYSSHCLEHMRDLEESILNWIRVCKPGGHLYIIIPDEEHYEQGFWPSKWNKDHKFSFTLDSPSNQPKNIVVKDLLSRFLDKIEIIEMFRNLQNYNFNLPKGTDQTFIYKDKVCCQIEFILRKL